jgi:membrane protein
MIVPLPHFRKATLAAWRDICRAAGAAWLADRAPSMGAAMAYYMVFSLAPVLILVIAVAGLVFGQAAAQGAIVRQLGDLMGVEGATALQAMIASAAHKRAGIVATLVGTGTLLVAATAVFGELQASLNVIWKVQRRRKALIALARERLLSLSLILALGFLLLVSLVLSAALTAFGQYLNGVFPGLPLILRILHLALAFGLMSVLFAMIFKILPDTLVAWQDVWVGAMVTALLFSIGKYLIGLYIGSSNVASTYGAAGALVIILVWIYYSAQILLFGAEFTKACADHRLALVERARGTPATMTDQS